MEDIRIESLEKRMDKVEVTVQDNCKKIGISDAILLRFEETQSKLVEALQSFGRVNEEIKLTLRDMQNELKNNGISTQEVKIKITEIEKKFDESEEKSKIDWRIAVKDSVMKTVPWLISLAIAIAYIIKDILLK